MDEDKINNSSRSSTKSVGAAILELRSAAGETQSKFALRMNIALSTLARYESGIQAPKASILKALAEFARKQGSLELATILRQGFDSRVEHRGRIRALRDEGIPARLASLILLTERSRKESLDVLNDVKATIEKRLTDITSDRRVERLLSAHGRVERLLSAATEQEKAIRELERTLRHSLHHQFDSASSVNSKRQRAKPKN
jgi:transcriptional regulator with XRE-family HTH domain